MFGQDERLLTTLQEGPMKPLTLGVGRKMQLGSHCQTRIRPTNMMADLQHHQTVVHEETPQPIQTRPSDQYQ